MLFSFTATCFKNVINCGKFQPRTTTLKIAILAPLDFFTICSPQHLYLSLLLGLSAIILVPKFVPILFLILFHLLLTPAFACNLLLLSLLFLTVFIFDSSYLLLWLFSRFYHNLLYLLSFSSYLCSTVG